MGSKILGWVTILKPWVFKVATRIVIYELKELPGKRKRINNGMSIQLSYYHPMDSIEETFGELPDELKRKDLW